MNFRPRLLSVALACAAASAGAEEIPVGQVLQDALDHSHARRAAAAAVQTAEAREDQAKASGRFRLDVGARAAQYEGLEDSQLGALTLAEIDERMSAFAQATQPLYTGGRVRHQREAERLARESADATGDAVTAGVAFEALSEYWGWSRAFQSVGTAEAFVQRMEALYGDVRHQHEAGMITESDLLATEVELERARLRRETAVQSLALARARVAFLTGRTLSPEARPEAPPEPEAREPAGEEELLALALKHRPERAAMAREVEAAEARVRTARADRAPTLNLRAGYEYAQPNLLFFPPEETWNDDLYAGVDLAWNLWDSNLNRARVAEAASRRVQAEIARDRLDEEIALQVRTARIRLQEALNRHRVAVRARHSAQRNLASAESLWKNGLARHAEVLDAQARLAEAEDAVVAAVCEVAIGHAGLEYACGTRPEQSGLQP